MLRVAAILIMALVLLMAVVILRTETTRIHRRIAKLDREAMDYAQQIRESDILLARLRNPMLIRQRVADLRLRADDAAQGTDH